MRKDFGFSEAGVAIDVSGGNQALPLGCRAFYVGGAGNLAVTMWDGGNLTFVGASGILPIRASAVLSSGTTATDVIALL
jgi:hypothetical protein